MKGAIKKLVIGGILMAMPVIVAAAVTKEDRNEFNTYGINLPISNESENNNNPEVIYQINQEDSKLEKKITNTPVIQTQREENKNLYQNFVEENKNLYIIQKQKNILGILNDIDPVKIEDLSKKELENLVNIDYASINNKPLLDLDLLDKQSNKSGKTLDLYLTDKIQVNSSNIKLMEQYADVNKSIFDNYLLNNQNFANYFIENGAVNLGKGLLDNDITYTGS